MLQKRMILSLVLAAGLALIPVAGVLANSVSGRVTDSKGGLAVANATVLVKGTRLGAISGLDGNFTIEGLAPGSYELDIFHTGFKTQTREIQVDPAGVKNLDVVLAAAVYTMEKTVITGSRGTESQVRNLPASISVVSSDQIEMRGMLSADDGLKRLPGVKVSRRNGLATAGSHAGVSLRGLGNANRTLIMKDGIPQNGSYLGSVSIWNTMASCNLKRIEIVRGASSSLYGSAAMGGVINLITDSPGPQPSVALRSEYGSQGTSIMGLKLGKAFSNGLGVMLSGERKLTDGYRYRAAENWKNYYLIPNNDLLNTNLKVDYTLRPGSTLELVYNLDLEQPVYGTTTRYDNNYNSNNVYLRYSGRGGAARFESTVFVNRQLNKSLAMNYSSASGQFSTPNYTYRIPTNDIGYLGMVNTRHGGHSLTLGTDITRGTAESRYDYVSSGERIFEGQQLLASAYLNDDIALSETWSLSLGVRFDRWSNREGYYFDETGSEDVSIRYPDRTSSRVSPRAGLVYHINENSRLRSSYATGFKAPGLYHLYRSGPHGSGTYDVGNPYLSPEIMNRSVELGGDFLLFGKLEASATGFSSTFEDFVGLISISEDEIAGYVDIDPDLSYYRYTNIGKVDIYGFETDFRLPINAYWIANLNYTFSVSDIKRHEADPALVGKELEDTPRNSFNLGLAYDNPRWFGAGIWMQYIGSQYADALNTGANKIDGYALVDLKAHRELMAGIDLSLSVHNLFDKKYYGQWSSATSYYYGAPRMVMVGLNYNY